MPINQIKLISIQQANQQKQNRMELTTSNCYGINITAAAECGCLEFVGLNELN